MPFLWWLADDWSGDLGMSFERFSVRGFARRGMQNLTAARRFHSVAASWQTYSGEYFQALAGSNEWADNCS
jgi:hypothetical protein